MIAKRIALVIGVLVSIGCSAEESAAHARGNHAGDWAPGQEVKVCVCPPPGGADFMTAIEGALGIWNDSKVFVPGMSGLKMTWHLSLLDCSMPPAECDVTLDWSPGASWGTTGPGTMPVPVNVEPNDGLDARGVQRVLMHELGHVKGLGHSALSTIMKWNFRGAGGNSPTAGDLNSEDAFETPNDDDNALNKLLHTPVVAPPSKSNANGAAEDLGGTFRYTYQLDALVGPSFMEPVTRFTLELPPQINGPSGANVIQMPPGWNSILFTAEPSVVPGKKLDGEEQLQRCVLTFFASNPGFGLFPGSTGIFAFLSPFPPGGQRAYTNSPSATSDEFLLAAPASMVATQPKPAPALTFLRPPAPNPIRTRTVFRIGLASEGPASLAIFDAAGRKVRTLLNTSLAAGEYRVTWDVTDEAGRRAPSGIYLVRLEAAGVTRVERTAVID